ncbi:MAG: hypothetical protein U5M51_10955 [Emticicia sp.]|nr:hypothetical protein [Emticicia sp.]
MKARLYVLIMKDYPNERKELGEGDYILICEDTDKDSKADKSRIRFAEGLSIPIGMVLAKLWFISFRKLRYWVFLKDLDGRLMCR